MPVPEQPTLPLLEIGHDGDDLLPECTGVVQMLYMGQLMYDNVIDDVLRRHGQTPAEAQIPFVVA